jgi:CheY-like chemotaxis protein
MSNATILVVDDEPQIRRVLQATLSSNGYDVIEAKNGREAITAVLREHPDLILLDVNMRAPFPSDAGEVDLPCGMCLVGSVSGNRSLLN